MAGFTQYNTDQIHTAVAALNGANHDFQEHAGGVSANYNLLDETSGGNAVQAGMDFNTEMKTTRQDVSDTVDFIVQAITESHDEMTETDDHHALSMGHN